MVTKEYFCPGHGSFEGYTPVCPHGCTVAEREFRTAPPYHNGNNRRVDNLVRSQVEAMGISNIKTGTREGETARIETPAMRQQAEFQKAIRAKYPSNWGAVAPGGTMRVDNKEILNADRGPGAGATLAAHHAEPADVVGATRLRGAKPSYQAVQDKQGLKLDISKAA